MDTCDLPTDPSFNAALDDYSLLDSNGGYDSDSSYHTAPESLPERESTVAESSLHMRDTDDASFATNEEIQAEIDALLKQEQLSQQVRQKLEREIELRKRQEVDYRLNRMVLQGKIVKKPLRRIPSERASEHPSEPKSLSRETRWRLQKVLRNIKMSKELKKAQSTRVHADTIRMDDTHKVKEAKPTTVRAGTLSMEDIHKVKEAKPTSVRAGTLRLEDIYDKYSKLLGSVKENARNVPTPVHDFTIKKVRTKRYFTYDQESESFVKPSKDLAMLVTRPPMYYTRFKRFSVQLEINEDGDDIACPNEGNGGMCVDLSCTFSHGDAPMMRKQKYQHKNKKMKCIMNDTRQSQTHDTQQKYDNLCEIDPLGEVCKDKGCSYKHLEDIYKVFGCA